MEISGTGLFLLLVFVIGFVVSHWFRMLDRIQELERKTKMLEDVVRGKRKRTPAPLNDPVETGKV